MLSPLSSCPRRAAFLPSVAVMLIFGLLFGFCVTVVLPVLGGALSAKVLEKE